MSGGTDSTAAALLLKEQGFLCEGAMMRLYNNSDTEGARAAAEALNIPFRVFDCGEVFQKTVIEPFISAYRAGSTPNPCICCNKFIKFGVFLEKALELGFEKIATGHYARVEERNGLFWLKKGADPQKDQSYVLYTLKQEQLSRILFPLGGMTKKEVRGLLPDAPKGESQDICFIPDGDYAAFIGGESPKGRFTDTLGRDLGEHKGIIHYTVGQRRGLGLSHSQPLYVREICRETHTVVVGTEKELYSKKLTIRDISLITLARIDRPLRAAVKIRYRHQEQPATVTQTDEDTLLVEFDQPQRAVTPGQAAVIYDDDIVIGGGIIKEG
jgi:tRNA-specific 2-thiouridylase